MNKNLFSNIFCLLQQNQRTINLKHFFSFILQSEQATTSTLDESATEETPLSPKHSLDNAFTIKDLSSLLKNLEAEITLNEQHLNDENDKRYMFKVSENPCKLSICR